MKKLSANLAMVGLLWLTAFVTGCASTTITDPGKLADLGMPSPGKSKVVFMRPSSFGFAIHYSIHDGERMIGRSSSSTYFVYECDPGHHVFSTSMENLAFLDADLLPDRIYYVRVEAVMGMWIARVKISALYPGCAGIDWKKMPGMLAKLEKSTITNDDMERDTQNIKGYKERLKKYQDKSQPDKDAEKILPEYGQATPIFLQ